MVRLHLASCLPTRNTFPDIGVASMVNVKMLAHKGSSGADVGITMIAMKGSVSYMKTLIVFNDYEDIYRILGWKFTGDSNKDAPLYDKLWDNGFNLDDWDIGFACKEPLGRMVKDDENDERQWFEWDDDVYWLGMKMENYYVGYHHCEFGGYHWYTVHH